MHLKSVEITNYRLFYKCSHFDFSSYQNKSLNIIFGRNGSGKSSLIEAIYWCLYGSEMREIGSEPIYNNVIADETPNGDTFSVKVILSFIDVRDREVIINRLISFNKTNNKIIMDGVDFSVYIEDIPVLHPDLFIRKNFNQKLFDLMYINQNNILSDSNFCNDMKSILFDDSQLNIILNTLNHLKKAHNKLLKEYKNTTREASMLNKYNHLVNEYEELCEEIKKIEENIYEIQQSLDECRVNVIPRDMFLKRDNLLKEYHALRDNLMGEESNYYYLVLSSFPLAVLFNDLGHDFKTSFEKHYENDNFEISFKENILNLKHDLNVLKNNIRNISYSIKHISDSHKKIKDIYEQIHSINDLLSYEDPEIYDVISSKEQQNKILEAKRNILKDREKFLKREISSVNKKVNRFQSESSEFHKKEEFYRNAIDNVNNLHDNLFNGILTELSELMNKIFIQDLGMSDKFSNIIIDSSFDFEIIKNSGKYIKFFDLSLSEQYMLYLAFTMSIQNIINQDIFLIIDTQFLDFDKEHWLNFLSLLKNNNYQYFLLFNDSKYDDGVKFNLMDNICNEYELINSDDKIKVITHEN